ncbi:MAG: hypothetical protein B9S34_04720 [Opitutia bacterium Tous-C1TDCM]|nr:MAG: hypothetical protein B9S34_04720 [Opitutae bacterium Tous-C1TDCM]
MLRLSSSFSPRAFTCLLFLGGPISLPLSAQETRPKPAAAPKVLTLDEHRTAAAAGNAESMYRLGLADIQRRQLESNQQTGPYCNDPQRNATDFRWIMSAARAGHPGAQFLAATHWLSAETAAGKRTWLEKAAAQGHVTAKERLAADNKAAVGQLSADAAEAKAAAEDEKLAEAKDPDAAYRALRRRIGQIAKAISENFVAQQRGQRVAGPPPQMGQMDGDMTKWADTLVEAGHPAGASLIYGWCSDTQPRLAYLALLLRRELTTLHPDLALKEGAPGIESPAGWAKAQELLRTKLAPALRTEIEGTATRLFASPGWLVSYGINFLKGRSGYPQDYDQAVRLYRKAADAGSSAATYNLATCYWSGLGVPRDQPAAYDLMKKAQAMGCKEAAQGIAVAEKDPAFARLLANRQNQADAWDLAHVDGELLQRALSGEAKAQSAIGLACVEGKQVPQNYDRAFYWLSRAAEKEQPGALHNLGMMFAKGYGRPADQAAAFGYYLRAAQTGLAVSQYNAGINLLKGEGVPTDVLAGHDWIKRAADQGHAMAKDAYAKISATPDMKLLLAQREEAATKGKLGKNAAAGPGAAPAPTAPVLDGKVAALNPGTFAALQRIKT